VCGSRSLARAALWRRSFGSVLPGPRLFVARSGLRSFCVAPPRARQLSCLAARRLCRFCRPAHIGLLRPCWMCVRRPGGGPLLSSTRLVGSALPDCTLVATGLSAPLVGSRARPAVCLVAVLARHGPHMAMVVVRRAVLGHARLRHPLALTPRPGRPSAWFGPAALGLVMPRATPRTFRCVLVRAALPFSAHVRRFLAAAFRHRPRSSPRTVARCALNAPVPSS